MKNPTLLLITAILMVLAFFSCNKDDDNPPVLPAPSITTPAELTAALTDIYAEGDAPGFAVSVVKDDGLLYQQAFGKADVAANKRYTNQTMQLIGSISKTFVAAAVVKAIEQGYFTLETDINDILPIEVSNPKQPNAVIQVKHLVTHTSGLLDHEQVYLQSYHILLGEDLSTEGAQLLLNGFGFQQRERTPLEAYLAEYYLEDGDAYSPDNFAATAPGTAWNYSNIATSLAAYLVESATGTSFKAYVKANILDPLGMSHTAYDVAALNSANVAQLYWDESIPFPLYANDSYPDGSIYTSNEDLAKYLMDMMKGARGQSATLFSKESYDLLFNALLPDGIINPNLGENQGVFWFLGYGNIGHSGSDPGTNCNLQFDEEGEAGYILMTNMDASTDDHETAYVRLATKIHNAIIEFTGNN